MSEPQAEADKVDHHNVDAAVEDLLPDSSSCDKPGDFADDGSTTYDVHMEDCSVTSNCPSNESDVTDCNMVSFIIIIHLFTLSGYLCIHVFVIVYLCAFSLMDVGLLVVMI